MALLAADADPGPAGPGLWSLHARTDLIAGAAHDWRALARAATVAVERVRAATDPLADGWSGESQQAYAAHRGRLLDAVLAGSTMAGAVAEALDRAVSALATAQDHLDDSWSRLRRAVPGVLNPLDRLLLSNVISLEAEVYAAAQAEARDIRAYAELVLLATAGAMSRGREAVQAALTALTIEVPRPWPSTGQLGAAGEVILDGHRAIINGSSGDDHVTVEPDPGTGGSVVTITSAGRDPIVRRFSADTEIVVRGGAGADYIAVAPSPRIGFVDRSGVVVAVPRPPAAVTVLAGDGDDVVTGDGSLYGGEGRDILVGGAADDYLSGGDGNDYLDGGAGDDDIAGGRGGDTLYGLDGADRLWGGSGVDYLDGGRGDDVVSGDAGNDMAFGGRGADTILGGAGDDRLYGGEGIDHLDGGAGTDDRAFAQPGDDVHGVEQRTEVGLSNAGDFILLDRDQHDADRVESDLDALRSSPTGEQMLTTLQLHHVVDGDSLIITRYGGHNDTNHAIDLLGPRSIDIVQYNPGDNTLPDFAPAPPVVMLYHELAHVDDSFARTSADGTYAGPDNPGVDNREREAVGLPIDDDHDPRTPDRLDPDHPWELTENGFRAELGLPARPRY